MEFAECEVLLALDDQKSDLYMHKLMYIMSGVYTARLNASKGRFTVVTQELALSQWCV